MNTEIMNTNTFQMKTFQICITFFFLYAYLLSNIKPAVIPFPLTDSKHHLISLFVLYACAYM